MAPKRKAAVDAADGDIVTTGRPPAKSIKSPAEIDGVEVQWQCEEKSKTWYSYPTSEQSVITAAYTGGAGNVTVDGGKLLVDVKKLTQKTVATRYSRRIRLAVKAADGGFYAWHTVDSRKRPTWYSVADVLALEKAYADGAHDVRLTGGGDGDNERVVNLVTMLEDEEVAVVRLAADALPSERKADATVTDSASSVDAGAAVTLLAAKEEAAKLSNKKETKTKAATAAASASAAGSDDVVAKTVVIKGKAPVDSECKEKLGKAHVYCEGKDVWDCMLNQTFMQHNNNKYYLIQLLEDDNVKRYSVWMRWGRVGKRGQMALASCGPDLEEAKKIFTKKFHDKTKNDWSARSSFAHIVGKYDLIKMDYSKNVDEVDSKAVVPKKPVHVPSKLDQRVQDLLNMICDIRAMEDTVVEMSYDARKAPLGMVTKEQIQAGYEALEVIGNCIKKGRGGEAALMQACNDFYTRIPHDFGMRVPPLIKTEEMLRAKLRLLEALADIEIAVRVLKSEEASSLENPVDRHYRSLQCDVKPLEKESNMFKLVNKYLQTTHAATHSQYSMELVEVFECSKESEQTSFTDFGNRMLLWHGSRVTNWMGILCTGLRIAPPEAPVTGYMFGKGIYFSDMSSKSANYCMATRSRDTGLIALCEVSLGNTNDLLEACYTAGEKLPKNKHSVKGLGKMTPDPATHKTLSDGVVVPIGKGIETAVAKEAGYRLFYNEYIIYKTTQQKLRYICKVKFHFK